MGTFKLRAAQANDLEDIARWLSEPQTNRWLFSQFRGKTPTARGLRPMLVGGKNRLFVGELDNRPCVVVGIANIDRTDHTGMLWWALGDKTQGSRGLTTRAVSEVIELAFNDLDLHSVNAVVMAPNAASLRVCEKVGLQPAGIYREGITLDGEFVDAHLFDAVKGDWQKADPA